MARHAYVYYKTFFKETEWRLQISRLSGGFEKALFFMQICSADLGQVQKRREWEAKLVIIHAF